MGECPSLVLGEVSWSYGAEGLYAEVSTEEGRGWEEKEGHLMTPSEAINHTQLNFFPCHLPQK